MKKSSQSLETFLEVIKYLNKAVEESKKFEFSLNNGKKLKMELLPTVDLTKNVRNQTIQNDITLKHSRY